MKIDRLVDELNNLTMTVTIVRDKSFSVFEGKITAEIADLDEEQDINIVIDDTSFGVCECEGEE